MSAKREETQPRRLAASHAEPWRRIIKAADKGVVIPCRIAQRSDRRW